MKIIAKKSSYKIQPKTYYISPAGLSKSETTNKKKEKDEDFTKFVILALIGGMVYVDNGLIAWLIYMTAVVTVLMIRNTKKRGEQSGTVSGSRGRQ